MAALPSRSKATSSQYHQKGSTGAQPSGRKMKVTLLPAIDSERVPQFLKDCDPETTGRLSPFFTVDSMKPRSRHLQHFWKARLLLLVPLKILQGTNLGRMREKEGNTTDLR